jgi:hypothetical protein
MWYSHAVDPAFYMRVNFSMTVNGVIVTLRGRVSA